MLSDSDISSDTTVPRIPEFVNEEIIREFGEGFKNFIVQLDNLCKDEKFEEFKKFFKHYNKTHEISIKE